MYLSAVCNGLTNIVLIIDLSKPATRGVRMNEKPEETKAADEFQKRNNSL